jgi:thymidine kinase
MLINIINMTGSITLILGPMFSSKTTELIRQYNRNAIANKKCIMIKYSGDNRYDNNAVVTHDGMKVTGIKSNLLKYVDEQVKDYDVVCVDEVQFYSDGDEYCDKWANQGKKVYACGLSGTFKRTEFPVISRLIPKVEKIKFLTAICKENGNEASFSKLDMDNTGDTIEIIGGAEKYRAVDRTEYFRKN